MTKRPRPTVQSSITDIISSSYSVFQELRDEMGEWESNLSSNNMEHLPKYEEVSEAQSNLDSFADNEPDIPKKFDDVKLELRVPLKSETKSRAGRLSVAVDELQRVIDHLESIEDDEEAQELREALEEAIGEAENVCFPGMY